MDLGQAIRAAALSVAGQGRMLTRSSARDVGAQADRLLHDGLGDVLSRLGKWPVVSEEEPTSNERAFRGMHWWLDPLDGTYNYAHGVPLYCCSAGLWDGDEPVAGIIFDPERDELFVGCCQPGMRFATLNGQPIQTSAVPNPREGVLATGIPSAMAIDDESVRAHLKVVQGWKRQRLLGSAALSLAWVACGRLDAYHERSIYYWDVAAGLALTRAAGGETTHQRVGVSLTANVWATNGAMDLGDIGVK